LPGILSGSGNTGGFGVLAKTKSKFVSEALAEKASDREIV
jgi:hypothetical protein